jgi:hypothetical protein
MSKAKQRKSLSLRLQPYSGTPLAEVVDYLNSLEKEQANKKVGEILVMTLLPYARAHSSNFGTDGTSEELRLTCLESCDAMDKHASTMRQALRVEQPQFSSFYRMASVSSNGLSSNGLSSNGQKARRSVSEVSESDEEPDYETEENPSTLIQDKGSIEAVDSLF